MENNVCMLISHEEIEKRLANLAIKIRKDYGNELITFVIILKGSIFFGADLVKHFDTNVALDFMCMKSYVGTETSGEATLKFDTTNPIEGKNILIVEDIIDTGLTMDALVKHLKTKNPKSVKVCSLLSKPSRREIDVKIDYLGFEIPDKFVVGYGLDYNEKYRNLNYIGVMK